MKKNIIAIFSLCIGLSSVVIAQTNHEEILPPAEKVIIADQEEMPQYPGGDKALFEFIKNNIQYPKEAKKIGLEGKVYVKFVIDVTGSVSNVELAKGIENGKQLEEEAIRVVKLMPKWTAGMQGGKAVSVAFTLPISFYLDPKDKVKQ